MPVTPWPSGGRRRRPEDPTATLPEAHRDHEQWEADPGETAVRSAESRGVLAKMDCLTEREREAIALRFGAELSSAEIGAAMGISPTAARMLVHRGVGRLREVMTDE